MRPFPVTSALWHGRETSGDHATARVARSKSPRAFDHTRLTYRFGGRYMRLTDVHGEVVRENLDAPGV